jgi:hypothetical protein
MFNRFKDTDITEADSQINMKKPRVIMKLEPQRNFQSDQISIQVSEQNFSDGSSAFSKKMSWINHFDPKDMESKAKKRKGRY